MHESGILLSYREGAIKDRLFCADKYTVTSTASPISYKEKALKSLSRLPPLSPILNRLLASLANDNVSFAQLATLIEKDTVLAGNVLRMVNSALFACRGTINSVNHAIAIMGMVKLRNTALGFSVNTMWKSVRTPRGWSMARFNLHSVATGMMVDLIAQRVSVEYAEGAFVSGLFHDIGKLLIAIALIDEYENIVRFSEALPAARGLSPEQCETEVLGVNHCQLSASAMATWNLPIPIQMAVLHHHIPSLAPAGLRGDSRFHLAEIIHAADSVVKELDITNNPPRIDYAVPPQHEALLSLGLTDGQISKLMEEFRVEFEVIRTLV